MKKEEQEDTEWAKHEFREIELGDERRKKRLIELAGQRAKKPNASISESCGSKAGTKAAYRLYENEDIEGKRIIESHAKATIERAAGAEVILAVQDTTQLDYTKHKATIGLGYLQDLSHQGMLVHSTMLVSPERVPYGIIQQQVWIRLAEDFGKRRKRKQRSIEEKESRKWLTGLAGAAEASQNLEGSLLVSVGDSEADVYDLFVRGQELNQALLIRACRNRRVAGPERLLWDHLASQEVAGEIKIQVPRRAGKKSREARLRIRYAPVTLRAPSNRSKERLPNISIWGILVREIAPPQDEEAIEWLLLTTVATHTLEDALERVQWYTCRWVIEMYHKVLKSGCRVEERQFAHLENLKRYLALDAVVAWRVLYLTLLSRETPEADCTVFLNTAEWQALHCFVHKTKSPPRNPPALRDVTFWIASLGGFMGRKSDGHPGSMTIWRGLQRLADITDAWLVFHE